MVSRLVPGAVQVVSHHVDEVQVPGDPRHVVTVIDAELGWRHSGGQEQALRDQGGRELLHQTGEVLLVIPSPIPILQDEKMNVFHFPFKLLLFF